MAILRLERQESVRRRRQRRAGRRPSPEELTRILQQEQIKVAKIAPKRERLKHPLPQEGEGQAQGAGHLQPPAVRPDRRRAAPDPEPEHPGRADPEQVFQEGHHHGPRGRRGRVEPEPGPAQVPQGLRRPVLQPDRLGRAERLARHHAPAAGRLHREDRSSSAARSSRR